MTTEKLTNRFIIISTIVIVAFILTFLIFKSNENFLTTNSVIGFAVWAWLIFDSELLQENKLYFGSIVLGLTIFLYGQSLKSEFSQVDKSVQIAISTTMPIFFLIIQRPTRFAFKEIMKREPIVDRPAPSIADFIYTFIIWMASGIIPVLYFSR